MSEQEVVLKVISKAFAKHLKSRIRVKATLFIFHHFISLQVVSLLLLRLGRHVSNQACGEGAIYIVENGKGALLALVFPGLEFRLSRQEYMR
jgi:hypothetical protein